MTRGARTALIAAVVVIAVVAFIVLKPSDSSKKQSSVPSSTAGATPASVPNVRVQRGRPAGGIQTLKFTKGDTIQFKVTSDVADEVHVHGYDIHRDVAPGRPVTFRFPGTIDGEFVVELEKRSEQIASLQVAP